MNTLTPDLQTLDRHCSAADRVLLAITTRGAPADRLREVAAILRDYAPDVLREVES